MIPGGAPSAGASPARPPAPETGAAGAANRLDRGLEELGCAALVVLGSAHDPDMAGFVGPVHLSGAFLVAPLGAEPHLGYLTPMERDEAAATGLDLLDPEQLEIARWSRELPTAEDRAAAWIGKGLELAGVEPGRIALAGGGRVGTIVGLSRRLESFGWTVVPGNRLARQVRKVKGERQLAAARRTAAGTCTAFRRVADLLSAAEDREGELWLEGERLKVARLRWEVARTCADFGFEQPEGNLIAPAEEGAVPHSKGTDERVLRSGESLVVDLFPRGWLFADCTRTFCVGRPPEALKQAHATLLGILDRIYPKIVPGYRAFSLQDSVCGLLKKAGYPTPITDPGTTRGYVHNLGHGVGFELHEEPSFRREAGEEGVLEVGDLLTIEPGLYDPEAGWGLRLEDLVYLGTDGPENLTPLPYDLDPRAWG